MGSRSRHLAAGGCLAGFVAVGAALVVSGGAANPSSRSAPGARGTLVTLAVTDHPIEEFAQDGTWFAWLEESRRGFEARRYLYIANAVTSRRVRWRLTDSGDVGVGELTLAGQRAFWIEGQGGAGETVASIQSVAAHDRKIRGITDDIARDNGCAGTGSVISDTAADHDLFVYAVVDYGPKVPGEDPCDVGIKISSGTIFRVEGARSRGTILNAPPAARLAVAGDRVVAVRADGGRRVTLITTGGRLLRTFSVSGSVMALTLSDRLVGVVTKRPRANRIEIYSVTTGKRLRVLNLPRGSDAALAVSNTAAVYARGTSIWMLNIDNGRTERLVRAESRPIGLSIEGRRVAWAETVGSEARVRAFVLART